MFTVTITKTTIKDVPAGKEWQVIKGGKAEGNAEWGYTPEIMKKKEIELKVYEQTVEAIDIRKVITAVNENPLTNQLTDEDFAREVARMPHEKVTESKD